MKLSTKICNKCKQEKSVSEYHTDPRNTISGLRGICNSCELEYQKNRYHTDPKYRKKKNRLGNGYYHLRHHIDPSWRRKPVGEL